MHIDMKLNFMHILADLGFGGVYPIYWKQERQTCHIIYMLKNIHTKSFKNQKRYNLDKAPSKPRRGQTKAWHKKVVQIISKSKSTHDREKTPIEKIPTRSEDTKRRILLERYQVKEKSRSKVSKLPRDTNWNKYLCMRYQIPINTNWRYQNKAKEHRR